MAHPIFLNTTIVFQDQQAFNLIVPDRIEQRSRSTTHPPLGAGFYGGLKILVERNATGMKSLPATDRATDGADITGVDANTGTLADVLDDSAGRGIDGIQRVATLNQDAGAELAGRGAHAGHDRGWQR